MKRDNGFTYLDVMVSFAIFGMMFVMLVKVGDSVHKILRNNEINNQMLHLASLEMENYKSGQSDLVQFLSDTGFILMSESLDNEGHLISRELNYIGLDQKFEVYILETVVGENVHEIQIDVKEVKNAVDPVRLISRCVFDSE